MADAEALSLISEQAYDLAKLPKDAWPLKSAALTQDEEGAAITIRSGGEMYLAWSGPVVDPAKISGIWLKCRLERNGYAGPEKAPIPEKSIIALWARKNDIKPGAFPFSLGRHVPFTPWADILLAKLASATTYPGAPIDQFSIRISMPKSTDSATYTLHIQSLGTINQ
jgi:hypothetical protein